MTITEIKENIIPYIGETSPYITIPENIIFKGNTIETEIKDWHFENENFPKLIKQLSSLGSFCLYKLLNDTTKEKIYFLGEKLRVRKLSYKEPTSVTISCESNLESNRKGKSYIYVKDTATGERLYSSEFDYYIITKDAFEQFYQGFHHPEPVEYHDTSLPASKIIKNDIPHHFTISTEPFTPAQCKGHFENYPIVPFIFIANCVLKEIFNFLNQENTYEIDSLEGYASQALPTGIVIHTEVFHQKFLKNLIYFKCEIKDTSGNSYGIIILNIKAKN
ncbi:hypothetical protein [Chryseobacterium sp. JK1]|uniref:hypothetical protein n=1 Tax=Chryseobacterium sp. JK1 TaxID=874294 RepID=UPI003D68117A